MLDHYPDTINPGSETLFLGSVKIHNLINFCRDEDGEAATAGIVSVFSSAMALLRYYTPN
jgi:hypothetical protein